MVPSELQNIPFSEQKPQALKTVSSMFGDLIGLNRRLMLEAHLMGDSAEESVKRDLVRAFEAKKDRLITLLEAAENIEELCATLGKITAYPDREF